MDRSGLGLASDRYRQSLNAAAGLPYNHLTSHARFDIHHRIFDRGGP